MGTQLALIENDGEDGIVRAVSTSYSALVEHCKETYGHDITAEVYEGGVDREFTIEPTEITLVPSKI